MVQLAGPAAPLRLKKFYKTVTVEQKGGGFAVLLDGKPAKTRARNDLTAPTRAAAEAVAQEWRGEGDSVDFEAMMLTRLAATAVDLGAAQRGQWADEMARYAAFDLVCYRAGEPAALYERQAKIWSPYLDWAAERFGARLAVAEGVVAVDQPADALAAIGRAAAALGDEKLLAAKIGAELAGSSVMGLALAYGAFEPAEIFAGSRLDERFQAERWGTDAEAAAREARIERDFLALGRWIAALD